MFLAMAESLYQTTFDNIVKRYNKTVEQAEIEKAEALEALEKLRPFWEEMSATGDAEPLQDDTSENETKSEPKIKPIPPISTANAPRSTPDRVRLIVKEEFSIGDEVTQQKVYDKLVVRFPEELNEIEVNVRSRISKALKRQESHGILRFIKQADTLGKPFIFQKVKQEENESSLNFDGDAAQPQPDKVTEKPKVFISHSSHNDVFNNRGEFVMAAAIKKVVPELNGEKFDAFEFFKKIQDRYPNTLSDDKRNSFVATLSLLMKKGFIIRIEKGKDGKAPIFKENRKDGQIKETQLAA